MYIKSGIPAYISAGMITKIPASNAAGVIMPTYLHHRYKEFTQYYLHIMLFNKLFKDP